MRSGVKLTRPDDRPGAVERIPEPARRDTREPTRDLAGWLALLLVVAGVVVLTTRGVGTDAPRARRPTIPARAIAALSGRSTASRSSTGEAGAPGVAGRSATRAPSRHDGGTAPALRKATASTAAPTTTAPVTIFPVTTLPVSTAPTATAPVTTLSVSTAPTATAPVTTAPTSTAPAARLPTTAPATTSAGAPATTTAHPVPPTTASVRPRPTVPTTRVPRVAVLVPAVVSIRWPGNFDYPDDVTATYTVRTSGGVVAATAAWSGTPVLTIGVACPGSTRTASGDSGLYVAAVATPGTCAITIGEPPGAEAVVSYSLVAHYPRLERQES